MVSRRKERNSESGRGSFYLCLRRTWRLASGVGVYQGTSRPSTQGEPIRSTQAARTSRGSASSQIFFDQVGLRGRQQAWQGSKWKRRSRTNLLFPFASGSAVATPMQITATRRHVDFHIGPVLCHGHPWREDPTVGSKGINVVDWIWPRWQAPTAQRPRAANKGERGQRAAKGQAKPAQEARSSQPARFRGMGPKIRRELG